MEVTIEFCEEGRVRGVALTHPDCEFRIALRERDVSASRPVLEGLDAFAMHVDSPEALRRLAARCDELGVGHSGVQNRGDFGEALDIPDPDGTVLRFLWEPADFRDGFWDSRPTLRAASSSMTPLDWGNPGTMTEP